MKITTFNPQIIAKDAEAVIKDFEALGFVRTHEREDVGDFHVKATRMKDPNGFFLDVSQGAEIPMDALVGIRMNVDDFEEAYAKLKAQGFKNIYGDDVIDTPSSRSAVMISPNGYAINLIEHIKD